MKFPFISSVLLFVFMFVTTGCQRRAVNSVVPQDWIVGSEAEPVANPQLEKSVDQLLAVHAEALDQINHQSNAWQLSGMIFELAVSLEGVLGLLMGEGEAAVKAIWLRSDSKQITPTANSDAAPLSISLYHTDTPEALRKHSDFLSQMAASTGRIRDVNLLRSNLMTAFTQFFEIGRLLNHQKIREKEWKLSEFRQVFNITTEGEVAPGISLGGLLEFEIRWKIESEEVSDQQNSSLDLLINGLVSDLNNIEKTSTDGFEDNGFSLSGFYIELGLKGESKFGIASESASAIGKLVFERADEDELKTQKESFSPVETSSSINIISKAPVPVSVVASHAVFRRGLNRALKMGRFFANRASKVGSHQWYIKEIEPEFELALNGSIGIATLEGSAALALEFERKEKP